MSLSNALNLWIEITGVDPSKQSFCMGDWNIRDMHVALKEALELDDTEITGRLLFEYLVTSYLKDRNFSVEDLLEKPDQVAKYLEKSRELLSYLRSEKITQIGKSFIYNMQQAVAAYGVTSDDVKKMSSNRHQLAVLRRDALRTMNNLSVHQFLAGTPEPDDYKPVYGKHVYRWWNINSMLKMMTSMPSGVTINMIVDPVDAMRSYFCFAIRNGGNLYIFTDKEKLPHPKAEDLWRRMDKVLAERMARNWFPYSLLGVEFNDEGRAFIKQVDTTALVPYQQEVQPVHPINQLDAPEVIWVTMMLSLIVDKFWKQGYQAPALCYTGEMIKVSSPLIDAAQASNLPVVSYQSLVLPPLTLTDVSSDSINKAALGEIDVHQRNRWLEDRYSAQLSDSCLNLVSAPGAKLITNMRSDNPGQVIPCDKGDRWGSSLDEYMNKQGRVECVIVDSTSFGTRDELAADRLFIARQNYARQINVLAKAEYEQRHKEVLAWVKAKILSNLENIWPLVAQKEVWVPCEVLPDHEHGAYSSKRRVDKRQFVERDDLLEIGEDGKKWRLESLYWTYGGHDKIMFAGDGAFKQSCPLCFKTNAPSSFAVSIMPETTLELASLCGCKIDELPDVLQHWDQIDRHYGNHILNRVDPLIWEVDNPWKKLSFKVSFMLSKRAMAAIDKQYGSSVQVADHAFL